MTESEKPVGTLKWLLRIFFVLILVAAMTAALAYKKYLQFGEMAAQGNAVPPPISVTVAKAQSAIWHNRVIAVGTLVANRGVEVASEVPGTIKAINFKAGQDIAAGALLFELNNQTEVATLGSAKARYEADNSQYQRLLKLKQKSFVTNNDLDAQASLVDISRAQVSVAEVNLAHKKINAPFSGKLGIRLVDIGDYISPGTPLVTLQAVDRLLLDFTLPERNFRDLAVGQAIEFKVRAYPDTRFKASVKAWNPVLDKNTRNITVQAEVNNRNRRLAPGMFAEMELTSSQQSPVITVPETAIFYNIYGEAVYVLEKQVTDDTEAEADYRLAARQVKVSYRRDGLAGIVQGIADADLVVTAGQLKLYPSLRVTIVDDVPAFQAVSNNSQ